MWPTSVWPATELPAAGYTALHSFASYKTKASNSASCGRLGCRKKACGNLCLVELKEQWRLLHGSMTENPLVSIGLLVMILLKDNSCLFPPGAFSIKVVLVALWLILTQQLLLWEMAKGLAPKNEYCKSCLQISKWYPYSDAFKRLFLTEVMLDISCEVPYFGQM